MLIRVNIRKKRFAMFLQRLQQLQGISVQYVHANPLDARTSLPRVTNGLLRQLKLGSMDLLGSRNVRGIAARWIVSPFLRQVEPRIDETDSISSPLRAKHSNLAVAEAPIPLTGHSDRVFACLLKRAFVYVPQPSAGLGTQQRVGVGRHSIHDGAVASRRVRHKILQHVFVAVRNRFGHPFHVALLRLHQTTQIPLCRLDHTVVARAKELIRPVGEPPVDRAQIIERFLMANPVFESTFRRIST